MVRTKIRLSLALIGVFMATGLRAEPPAFESFDAEADERWAYIADTVMGGVSEGEAIFGEVNGQGTVNLKGEVSTRNNGGFIQVRRMLPAGLPLGTTGIALDARGNGEDYYVFIRTEDLNRPWFFYSSKFNTTGDWQTVRLPLSEFERSHAHLAASIMPGKVISIGLVAYGRDHEADLMVREITLF